MGETWIQILLVFRKEKVALVKVYATWCGHCKSMQSDWDKIKAEFNGKKINSKTVKIISIDENQEDLQEEVMEKYNIDGYPTIFKCEMQNGQLTSGNVQWCAHLFRTVTIFSCIKSNGLFHFI